MQPLIAISLDQKIEENSWQKLRAKVLGSMPAAKALSLFFQNVIKWQD